MLQSPARIIAGTLLVVLSVIGIHKSKYQRSVAETLNYLVNGIIFVSVFCDIIKMSFGLDPAIAMVG